MSHSPNDTSDHQPTFWLRHFQVWKRAIVLFFQNNGAVAAGNLAFLTMMSLFPFLIFLFALSGYIGQTERGLEAVKFMLEVLPPEVATVLEVPINGLIRNTGADLVTVSILFAIWVASNGIEAARGIVLQAYGWEYAPAIWRRRLESLALVILAALAIIMAMGLMVITPVFVRAITEFLPDMGGNTATIVSTISTFVGPVILSVGLFTLYASLTPRSARKPHYLPGTLFSVLVLLGTARGFSVYLKYADNYDVTYGSLAGVIITQLFCYMVSIGFILGAEVNAAYAERAGETIEGHGKEGANVSSLPGGTAAKINKAEHSA